MESNINTPAKKRPSANSTDQSIDIKIHQPVENPAETDPELHIMAEAIFGKSQKTKLISEPSAKTSADSSEKSSTDSSENTTEELKNDEVAEISAEEMIKLLNQTQNKSENPLINISNGFYSTPSNNILPELSENNSDEIKENLSKGVLPTAAKALQIKSAEDRIIQKAFDKHFDELLSSMILKYGITLNNCLITVCINKNQIQYMRNIPGKVFKKSWKADEILCSEHELIIDGKRFEIEEYCSRIKRAILRYPASQKNIIIDKKNNGIKLYFY